MIAPYSRSARYYVYLTDSEVLFSHSYVYIIGTARKIASTIAYCIASSRSYSSDTIGQIKLMACSMCIFRKSHDFTERYVVIRGVCRSTRRATSWKQQTSDRRGMEGAATVIANRNCLMNIRQAAFTERYVNEESLPRRGFCCCCGRCFGVPA